MEKCAFAMDTRKCSILTTKRCMRCHFYKTEAEVEEGREKARERLEALPLVTRLKIAEKYPSNPQD